jgi:NAD(P)-dependent dehydrogenase (short-subunit alcohol dehydrogenase family)
MTDMLVGRHVLVTGGAKGIGAATVERFLAEGAKVAILDRDASAAKALAARSGASLFGIVADVSDARAVAEAVSACARELGVLDGVVNAAGIDLVADIETMSIEAWDRVLGVNLRGPMLVMRACYPHLKAAGGGTIVNVSSGAGLLPLANRTAYCASKAGLQMLSKALAMEGAPFKIRVNTVCPGAVETDLFRKGLEETPDPQAAYEAVRARYALRRIAGAEEIAAAILWLTSAESSFVTGTAIAVDGGRTFH